MPSSCHQPGWSCHWVWLCLGGRCGHCVRSPAARGAQPAPQALGGPRGHSLPAQVRDTATGPCELLLGAVVSTRPWDPREPGPREQKSSRTQTESVRRGLLWAEHPESAGERRAERPRVPGACASHRDLSTDGPDSVQFRGVSFSSLMLPGLGHLAGHLLRHLLVGVIPQGQRGPWGAGQRGPRGAGL